MANKYKLEETGRLHNKTRNDCGASWNDRQTNLSFEQTHDQKPAALGPSAGNDTWLRGQLSAKFHLFSIWQKLWLTPQWCFLLGWSVARSQIQIGGQDALRRGTAPPRTPYVVKKICIKLLFSPLFHFNFVCIPCRTQFCSSFSNFNFVCISCRAQFFSSLFNFNLVCISCRT